MAQEAQIKRGFRIATKILLVLVVLLGVLAGVLALTAQAKKATILPRVEVGPVDVSGLTQEQAETKLQTAWDEYARQGIPARVGNKTVNVKPLVSSDINPDLSYNLISFDANSSAQEAFAVGHRNKGFGLVEAIQVLVAGKKLRPKVEIDLETVVAFIRDSAPGFEQPSISAQYKVIKDNNLEITSESSGKLIDIELLEKDIYSRIQQLSSAPINVELELVDPAISKSDLEPLLPEARVFLVNSELVFARDGKTWRVPVATWHQWLEARVENGRIIIGLSAGKAKNFFDSIAADVNQEAKDAKFEVVNGKVAAFQSSQSGRTIDVEASLRSAESAIRSGETEAIALAVKEVEPNIKLSQAETLGIKEIIGEGRSNFKGSPKNRRHNIAVGAAAVNGTLIPPGEEFSLLKVLGKIEASTGYLQELVIKGNKTIPEFGGGLCQIGTTIFRAALASGLPILERQSHSYRVVYYEPAGTDATIYDPKPDFRFLNDTGYAILVQTRIEGDDLIFSVWGTKDGRKVEQTKPRIYNIVQPPPTKIIETTDLPVGKKTCTEKPHAGADAEFTYTVTYPNGEVKKKVFKSHYVPWQEVCLVGVASPPTSSSQ